MSRLSMSTWDVTRAEKAGVAGAQPMRGGPGGCPPDTIPPLISAKQPVRDAKRSTRASASLAQHTSPPGGTMAEVRVVKPGERDASTAQTPGMHREEACGAKTVGAEKLWVGHVHVGEGVRSGPHHHGELESVIYVISGNARFRFGDNLEHTVEADRRRLRLRAALPCAPGDQRQRRCRRRYGRGPQLAGERRRQRRRPRRRPGLVLPDAEKRSSDPAWAMPRFQPAVQSPAFNPRSGPAHHVCRGF